MSTKYAIYTEGYMPEENYKLVSCFHTLREAQALVKVGQVIVTQTGQNWPSEEMPASEIEQYTYKGDDEMTNETNGATVEKAEKRIDRIMAKLIDLRKQTDALSMQKAKLLAEVKDDKLYKDDFGNFGAFCDAIGYHRSTVSTLIDCYRIPLLRDNYTDIGARAGKMLVQAKNVGMDDAQLDELIIFASKNKSGVACEYIRQKTSEHCEAVIGESDDEQEENIESLSQALVRKAALIQRRKELVEELNQIDEMLKSLGKYIETLSE